MEPNKEVFMGEYTGTVAIDGKEYEYDPDSGVVQVFCSACGFKNDVDLGQEGETPGWDSFSCENCGHVISGKGERGKEVY